MPVTIGATENTFANPIGLLTDCHRRIERFLQALLKIADDAQGGALDTEHRGALEGALKYFRDSAPKHTADEEHDLFPALREAAGARAADVIASLDRLEGDHKNADAWHREVAQLGERWIRQDSLSASDALRLKTILMCLADLYRSHIAIEEQEIFPLAKAELSDSAQQVIGRSMASRRGVPFVSGR
jgi:hemerythrin-like domain-containing protein